jgi:hypothetical protein
VPDVAQPTKKRLTTNKGLGTNEDQDEGDHVMSQSHCTLSFPLKSPADAQVLAERLPPMMPRLFQAADTIGRVHYSRFTVLSERTLLLLGDFDGEFSQLMADLGGHAGPVFDAIFQHVDHPPCTPVADHADAFVEWAAAHLIHPLNVYTTKMNKVGIPSRRLKDGILPKDRVAVLLESSPAIPTVPLLPSNSLRARVRSGKRFV